MSELLGSERVWTAEDQREADLASAASQAWAANKMGTPYAVIREGFQDAADAADSPESGNTRTVQAAAPDEGELA